MVFFFVIRDNSLLGLSADWDYNAEHHCLFWIYMYVYTTNLFDSHWKPEKRVSLVV